jgi:predicted metal-dependent phosphoesterase TrpH
MYHYEMHMHTSPVSACAGSTPEDMVDAYFSRGYAGIIVTDHFVNGSSGCPPHLSWPDKMNFMLSGYELAKRRGDAVGLDVFCGWEFSYFGLDFLTYGLGLDFLLAHPNMETMTAEEYCTTVRRAGGFVAQAHPYRGGWWIDNPGPVDAKLLDAVEVLNVAMDKKTNNKALAWATKHNVAQISGTDSHYATLGKTGGLALPYKASSIGDVLDAIRMGAAALIAP